jgi:hypothetical protein
MGVSTKILIARRAREAANLGKLPDGYTATNEGGGYYVVTAPDGSEVEGPSNGKFQGHDGAVDGARKHAAMRLLER